MSDNTVTEDNETENKARNMFANAWHFVSNSSRKIRRTITSNKYANMLTYVISGAIAVAVAIGLAYLNLMIATGFAMIWTPLAMAYLVVCVIAAISWMYAIHALQNQFKMAEDFISDPMTGWSVIDPNDVDVEDHITEDAS